ncbi:MAG: MarR family transcriptional regulator [Clostridium sp.]|nr:MarR family transcriptional regulator [Clostridium sp.]MCM1397875.1 MarR family transcriptional regulator [Clostridium sp.]MCM1459114.1 MarR family transcriptional regulator [Bacteroides sp.]
MEPKNSIAVFRSCLEAYEHYCKPLCSELGMPQMAIDVLLFLANNPELCTAKDISRCRGFKENILSVNINKLVNEGFLERLSVAGDRRKVRLVCTQKAQPIIERAQKAHESFHMLISENLTKTDIETYQRCLAVVDKNAERIKKMNAMEV